MAVTLAVGYLLSGAVLLMPTETVYGLMTLWNNQAGRKRIYAMKQRPEDKQLQMLAASLEQAAGCGLHVDTTLQKLAGAFWPGPLTMVCPAAEQQTIGLRIPACDFLLSLLKRLEQPLAATSANRSGLPPAVTLQDALQQLNGEPELALDAGEISQTDGVASTVISLLGDEPQLLRAGPITEKQIQECLQK